MAKDKRNMKIKRWNAVIIEENYLLYVRLNARKWYLMDSNSEIVFSDKLEEYYQSKKKGKK